MDSEAAAQQLNAKQVSVLAMLRESAEELSGQDLHQRLRLNGQPIGLATVYRHLRQLQRLGLARCRHLPSGEALYAPRERDTHHLTCVSCGLTLPLDHCPMHGIQPQPEAAHGFELLFHTLEYFGRCSRCRQSAPPDS